MKSVTLMPAGALIVLALTAAAQTTPAIEPNPWTLEVGLNYVTGDFGFTEDTDVWMQATTIHFEQESLHLSAMIPFVSITGPASVIGDVGRPTTSSERGLGDISVAASYEFTGSASEVGAFDFTARVKLPTADDKKGLGTGETDTGLEVNYHRNLGKFTPFATLGYRFLGSNETYDLKDGVYATAGIAAPVADRTVGGVALSWRQRIATGADDAAEAMAFLSHRLDERWKVQGFALTGFSDASPDFGIGGLVGLQF